jgi:hypothetical protein
MMLRKRVDGVGRAEKKDDARNRGLWLEILSVGFVYVVLASVADGDRVLLCGQRSLCRVLPVVSVVMGHRL